jgi:hypothetical protein
MNAIRCARSLTSSALGVFCLAAAASGQDTSLLSTDTFGVQGNSKSFNAAVSSDGLLVAFESLSNNLVSGDGNGAYDVFLKDRTTGNTELISVDSSGVQGNRDSFLAQISDDGRFVVFSSLANNLVTGDTNGKSDVFLRDRLNGTTERVSIRSSGLQGNDTSYGLGVSSDGNLVYFESYATNLVANDTNGMPDVFVRNRATGKTTRVSVDTGGNEGDNYSYFGGMASDGSFVTFYSAATNLVPNDFNGKLDVFLHDLNSGITSRISTDPSGGDGNGDSELPRISADGRFVVYRSAANNLVANDTNGFEDVFVFDRATGVSDRVSVDSSGAEGNANSLDSVAAGVSTYGAISKDGSIVVFDSEATNLVANDTNGFTDVFIHNRTTGVTQRVSVDSTGAEADSVSLIGAISQDGLFIAFESFADNLDSPDTNSTYDIFGHQRCNVPASWSNYGSGFPGTFGEPTLTAQSPPALGSALTLNLSNSSGLSASGLLFIGFVQTSIHSGWGGDLLVSPFFTLPIPVPPTGLTLNGTIPDDETLCGFTLYLQAIESDPGAFKGVSFTQGMTLQFGY